jgi:NAD(P)-dependent dehydrogenase (short-subunit alcohol dehydrogenase family)
VVAATQGENDMAGTRTVVITGASRGMGLSAALQFAAAGDRVVAGVRSESGQAEVREAARARGVDLETVVMDVCDDAQVAAGIDGVFQRHGQVDVLVCNAGVGAVRTLEELSLDDLRAAMEINFYGVVRATKAVLPAMRQRGEGRLIAVSSVGGVIGQPFTEAYCAAKHALEGLYESLHPVAARFGVRVSIVEPGPVATAFSERSDGADRANLDVEGDPYGELWARYQAFMGAGATRKQDIDEAAKVIVDVAGEAEPKLRYQTSRFTTRLVGMKLADLDGSKVTAFTAGWLEPLKAG